jgi:oligopeptide transport system substrate-binding protein
MNVEKGVSPVRKTLHNILAVIFLGLLAFLGLAISAPAAQREFTFSMAYEIPGLDPQKANSIPSAVVGTHILEGLVRVHDGKVLPGMAESWEISEDGLVYTFHLRDALWSDGKPVTAHDFEYSFRRLLDPATAAEYAFAAYGIENGKAFNKGEITDPSLVGVKALDAKTFEIRLVEPMDYLLGYLQLMCFLPTRQDVVEHEKDAFATGAEHMVYNGPFVIKEWKHEQSMILEKNPRYWNSDAIKLDRAVIHQVYEQNTALNLFESGELDMVDIPSNLYEKYAAEGKAKVSLTGADDWIKVNVRPDPKRPWLADKDFRKALAWAIDREEYLKIATKGLYIPNLRYVLPIVAGVEKHYAEEYPLEYYTAKADPEKAKAHLKAAMDRLGIDDPAKISVTYLIQDQEECRLMAEALQDQIQRTLGITFNVQIVTRKQRFLQEGQADYELVYSGWGPDFDDPLTYIEIWGSDISHNNSGWGSKKFDDIVAASRKETDRGKRLALLFEAEKILLDEAPMIPLQLRRRAWMTQPGVSGIVRPFIGADLDFVYATVEK